MKIIERIFSQRIEKILPVLACVECNKIGDWAGKQCKCGGQIDLIERDLSYTTPNYIVIECDCGELLYCSSNKNDCECGRNYNWLVNPMEMEIDNG